MTLDQLKQKKQELVNQMKQIQTEIEDIDILINNALKSNLGNDFPDYGNNENQMFIYWDKNQTTLFI